MNKKSSIIGLIVTIGVLLLLGACSNSEEATDDITISEETGKYLGSNTFSYRNMRFNKTRYVAYFKSDSGNYYEVDLNKEDYLEYSKPDNLEKLMKINKLVKRTKNTHDYLLIDLTFYPVKVYKDSSIEIKDETVARGVTSEAYVSYGGTQPADTHTGAKVVLNVLESNESIEVLVHGFELFEEGENRTDSTIKKDGNFKVELYGGKYIQINDKWYEYRMDRSND